MALFTKAQKRVLSEIAAGKTLSVGYEPGDGCRPITARRLERMGLAITFATGEFDPWGPFVFIRKASQ